MQVKRVLPMLTASVALALSGAANAETLGIRLLQAASRPAQKTLG